ncbi:MAG: N-acetylmuramoyl-L-alanine amidase [Elusimicrobia bacterium]|nr:MAG: N-acetylmuramoyl-L-alanine amidase [Elusimicrobiota bacterium]KAF0157527.1 MAG: N-acetylmuramoyl-L-alanine amidase [Elusimicrobiota bacterium]
MLRKILISLVFAAAAAAPVSGAVDEASFSKNGKYVGKVETYSYGGAVYFDAARLTRYLGGKIYWYPVSGKMVFQLKGKKVQASVKSDEVLFDRESVMIRAPVIVRGGKSFLSRDFFASPNFYSCFGFSLRYDEAAGSLEATEKMSVASYSYFSHKDKTRLVLYLNGPLEYQTYQRANNLLLLVVSGGSVADPERIAVDDGVVKAIDMTQDNKALRIGVAMGENAAGFNAFKLSGPDRIVLDVLARMPSQGGAPAPASAEPAAAPEVIPPSAPAAADKTVFPALSPSSMPSPSVLAPAADSPSAPPAPAPVTSGLPDKAVVDPKARKSVIIDAGHGGRDPGGRRISGMKEKDINLAVARELQALLKKEGFFEVLMVRTSDVFVPLAARSEFANRHNADIFISLHANATRRSTEHGFEIYFMSENASDPMAAEVADYENSVLDLEEEPSRPDPAAMLLHSLARNEYLNEGSQLAAFVAREFEKHTPFKSRGVKQAAFYVLRGTYAPGILVEMGFMTNPRDQKNLSSSSVQAKMARAIHNGLGKYAELKGWK